MSDLELAYALAAALGVLCGYALALAGTLTVQGILARLAERRYQKLVCGQTVAYGNGHRATCCRRHNHSGDCATTLKALEVVGYGKAPF